MKKGKTFIISGPSGVGKSTVLRALFEGRDDLYFSVSATTRAAREGEVDGKDYHFIAADRFRAMIEEDAFLEYAEYVGNFYGTPAGPVDECLEKGVDVILEIEVQGALTVKNKRPDAKLVFIIPPTFADLELRLRSRGSESDEVIAKRLEKAKEEYSMANHYDYIVCNGEVEQAVDELRSIIKAARCTVDRRINLLRGMSYDAGTYHERSAQDDFQPVFAGEHCRKACPGHCRRR